jgi:hypothetical protein
MLRQLDLTVLELLLCYGIIYVLAGCISKFLYPVIMPLDSNSLQ